MPVRSEFSDKVPSLGATFDIPENKENDSENFILLKIAACIPVIGLFIGQTESRSLDRKIEALPLPKVLKPYPVKRDIADKNTSLEEIRTGCRRAMQLTSIERDYTKAALVNSLLTIALAVYALATDIIPFFIGVFTITTFSLIAPTLALVLYVDSSTEPFEAVRTEQLKN